MTYDEQSRGRFRPQLPLPAHVARQIARRAAQIYRRSLPRSRWVQVGHRHAADQIRAFAEKGEIGITAPPETLEVLEHLEKGTKPRIMRELAGRTIPIRDTRTGEVQFRRATANNIGRRRITSRDERGRILASKLTWRHPGIKANPRFDKAMRQAFEEWVRSLNRDQVLDLLENSSEFRAAMQSAPQGVYRGRKQIV